MLIFFYNFPLFVPFYFKNGNSTIITLYIFLKGIVLKNSFKKPNQKQINIKISTYRKHFFWLLGTSCLEPNNTTITQIIAILYSVPVIITDGIIRTKVIAQKPLCLQTDNGDHADKDNRIIT